MTCLVLRRVVATLGTAILALVATSCTVGPNYATPQSKVAGQWMENPAVTSRPPGPAETLWWHGFDDPILNGLIETAYRNNPSLQIAGVRVLEARAKLNKSIGELFPQQQDISGQLVYTRLGGSDYTSAQVLFGAT
jgi:outer membrane protein TolC